jgi:hypothetical protein
MTKEFQSKTTGTLLNFLPLRHYHQSSSLSIALPSSLPNALPYFEPKFAEKKSGHSV